MLPVSGCSFDNRLMDRRCWLFCAIDDREKISLRKLLVRVEMSTSRDGLIT
jgi:hypothetical protein